MTRSQAAASGRPVLVATRPMERIGRAREKGETRGLIEFLVDAETRTLLGCTILGVGGDEVINLVAAWMGAGLTVEAIKTTVLVHPTVAELLPWILDDLRILRPDAS